MVLIRRFIFVLAFGVVLAINPAKARLSIQETPQEETYQAQPLYEALAAEIYNQLGQDKNALDHYIHLISFSDDPAITKRATELATKTGQLKKALDTSKRWVELSPDNLEANQYLALLLLRNGQFKTSAKQLHSIYSLLEKSSEGTETQKNDTKKLKAKEIVTSDSLRFIGSLLAVETHHEKSYKVFRLYLKQFGNDKYHSQQKLISADLAMKAKKYSEVVSTLAFLDELDIQNLVDASAMKAKALQRLNKNAQAIQILSSIKDHKETSDSSRLELVRLLVLDKQKKKALPILEKLIVKHQKNNDLLKSLIALQIDQSQLKQADKNIKKLGSTKKYQHDANYFAGEVLEKRGSLEKALKSFKKVSGGSFLKNAHKKTINLIGQVNGSKVLIKFFVQKQESAEKAKDKAYWLKLHADHVFAAKKYNIALDLYTEAIQLAPENTLYHYHRGLLNERMGNLDVAESDFSFVINKRKNNADALNALGYMLSVRTKRLSEAKKYIEKAYAIKPNDPAILDSLGFVLFKTGDLSAAEFHLRKAYRLMKNPEVAGHLISVLEESDQIHEAQLIYDEMNKKYPDSKILNNVKQKLNGI